MASDLSKVGDWMGEHPYATGAIIFGGGLALLWMFGYIGGGSSSTASSGSGNAAAFYAAEAAQSQAGAAIQLGTLSTQAATAQAKIQADAATAIASTQADMATTINQQNTGSANTIAGLELQGSWHNADVALATTNNNNYYAYQTAQAGNQAAEYQTILGTIIPQELAISGGGAAFALPGFGSGAVNTTGVMNINDLIAQGYTPSMARTIAGFPGQ